MQSAIKAHTKKVIKLCLSNKELNAVFDCMIVIYFLAIDFTAPNPFGPS